MSRYAIVVIGYHRINTIKRLISSLKSALYVEEVDLILSIDNDGTGNVEQFARKVRWPYGSVLVRNFSKRLGLRRHVLTCGGYIDVFGYEALIVLEDDVVVAPSFFHFAVQAIANTENLDCVAGISLYAHQWNVICDRPFTPVRNEYDVYMFRFAQSWGQVWTRKQWHEFIAWYENKEYTKIDEQEVPDNVLEWPKTSWLKFFMEYVIDKDKFFVYPYESLTTNFSDVGSNYKIVENKMQVPIRVGKIPTIFWPEEEEGFVKYDQFFEIISTGHAEYDLDEIEFDLYGTKKKYRSSSRYVVTAKSLPYKVKRTVGLRMRPWEMNYFYNVEGTDIRMYDMKESYSKKRSEKSKRVRNWRYDTREQKIIKNSPIKVLLFETFAFLKSRINK